MQQPKAVYMLSFVELWNRFSHFGMRALLVLFMIKVLKFSDGEAFGIYTAFCALDKCGGIFGGWIAEKFLGLRQAVMWGGWLVASGHLCLSLNWFFLGLMFLIVGSSLFSTNIIALVGYFYEVEDEKRSSGFTLFYMSINIGALLATVLCGYLAENLGWEYGFGVAAIGMVIGNIILFYYRHLLDGKIPEEKKRDGVQRLTLALILSGAGFLGYILLLHQAIVLRIFPWMITGMLLLILTRLIRKKIDIGSMGVYLAAYIFFIAAETQMGSSLIVFADRMASSTFFGVVVPKTAILSVNPIVIVLFGAVASLFLGRIKLIFLHLLMPFLFAAIAFSAIWIGSIWVQPFPIAALMLIVAIIAFAELMISPMIYSHCSKVSQIAKDPKVTALVPVGHALGVTIGGAVSQRIAISDYTYGFSQLGIFLLIVGALLGAFHALISKQGVQRQ